MGMRYEVWGMRYGGGMIRFMKCINMQCFYFFRRDNPNTAATTGVNINPIKKVHSSPRRLFFPILSDTISAPAYQTTNTMKNISSCILIVVNEKENNRNSNTEYG